MERRPWFDLSPAVAVLFREHLAALTARTNAAIRATHSGPPADDAYWTLSAASTTHAIESFVAGIEDHDAVLDTTVFAQVGRVQAQAGRDLEEALSQFRVGAAVVWREVSTLGTAAGFEPQSLFDVAEGLFVYIDALSGICAQAYAEQQAAEAGAVEASRARLARLLLADPAPEPQVLAAAAQVAGCRLDQRFAAVVVADRHRDDLRALLPADALPGPAERTAGALLPDPLAPGRLACLEEAAARAGIRVAVGPAVAVDDLRAGLAQAQATLRLMERGVLGDEPVVHADRHTLALLLSADPSLTRQLAEDRLAPLASLRPAPRARLEETLRAWLDHGGTMTAVAAQLGVHPKTVKYRLDRLRQLLGPAVDAPETRLELHLALRARGLLDGTAPRF